MPLSPARCASDLVVLLCLASCCATAVHAQAPAHDVRATVVRIDGDDFVVDVGHDRVGKGRELTVYRAIEVRHPVTGKRLRDRFAIGTLHVEQVGQTLSIARLVQPPAHPLQVGDAAEAAASASTAAEVAASAPPPLAEPPRAAQGAEPARPVVGGDEAGHIGAVWHATLEQPPRARAALYAKYLREHPGSRYRDFLLREVAYLERFARHVELLAQRMQRQEGSVPARLAQSVRLQLPVRAAAHQPLPIAAAVELSGSVRGLILHARRLDRGQYQSFPMTLDAGRHARVVVPAELLRPSGLALFVEAVGERGEAVPAVGTVKRPLVVKVDEPLPAREPGAEAERAAPTSRVRFSSELASFDGTSGRDYFLITEGDFLLRVREGVLHGVRMGYGHFRGEGGTVEALDEQGLAPRPAGFTYGFLEAELALSPIVGLALRGTLGLGRPEVDAEEREGVTGGTQLRLRLGAADAPHLLLAGELLPEIGQRALLALYWEALRGFPMAAEVQVTDQPVNSDELAVRLVAELGARLTDRLTLALRPSYQLRTIRHAGPGIGVAASFDW